VRRGERRVAKVDADAARSADDEHGVVVADAGALADVQRRGEAVGGHRSVHERRFVGQREDVRFGNRRRLRVRARRLAGHRTTPEVRALVRVAAPAAIAVPAGEVEVREHAVPGLEVGDAGTRLRDDARELVARNPRDVLVGVAESALYRVLYRPRDAAGANVDEDFARIRRRSLDRSDVEFAAPLVEDNGVHGRHTAVVARGGS